MKPLADGTLRYAPRDLIAYLDGDFAAWCERMFAERGRAGGAGPDPLHWATPDEGEDEAALAARKGMEHERRYLDQVRARFPDMLELQLQDADGEARTLAAMRDRVSVIYQAHLVADGWGGYPDFLYRCDGADGCGGWHYTPWDTKLARSAKPAFLIQLCAYADMLEMIRGYRPTELVFVLGHGEIQRFHTRQYFHYYRRLRRRFADFQAGWDLARRPEPGLDRAWGRWEKTAERLLRESDHLSLVATITRGQVRRLEEAGIPTVSALAECAPDRRVPGVSEDVFRRLRTQARLQLASRGRPVPEWEHRPRSPSEPSRGLAFLPPPSVGDVFFDMEGFVYAPGGLEYLFGAVTVGDDVVPVFHEWWAHDEREERAAFEGFIDWVMERRRRWPDLHVYHYAAYEESAVKRLMGKHATRETEVDELLRAGVFVDLYQVVRQGFVIGAESYSLKKIEHLYQDLRSGPVLSAGGSMVEYQRWIDSGEPRRWEDSPLLQGIRDYNRQDCESLWGLRSWLRDRQRESGIEWTPDPLRAEKTPPADPDREAAEALADRLVQRGLAKLEAGEKDGDLDRLIGWLVEFHRREEKPMWWRMFDRREKSVEERFDDRDCLADLTRTERPAYKEARSRVYEYRYDLTQETKLEEGDRCFVAGTDISASIHEMDEDAGLVRLKSTQHLPDHLCLIPDEFLSASVLKKAIARYAEAWERGEVASQAVDDLLRRRHPRVRGHTDGRPLGSAREVAPRLDGTTLCIQGPPGAGKTFTAAAVIVELLRAGARVGLTAQSHKVILNAMAAVVKALDGTGIAAGLYKKGDEKDDPLIESGAVTLVDNDGVPAALDRGPCLVGGTAWLFARPELAGRFDYLIIDEAGQFSLANAVAVGLSARNLILVGDQMQLSQVTQGHHPGDTGLSCLEYLLHGQAAVPDDRGIFLAQTRRMHPDVCRFISEAVYEGRLGNIPETERHRIRCHPERSEGSGPDISGKPARSLAALGMTVETGIVWVPVDHDARSQSSDEECDTIAAIVEELLHRRVVDEHGVERDMSPADILVVAPFNLQVRCLKERLDPGIRIGSVDRFQGQEAAVVIVSLCSSTLEDSPRGAGFLLSPNRLNVAVSRAKALAIVVGCPELMNVRCTSLEEMRLVNLLCHLVDYAETLAPTSSRGSVATEGPALPVVDDGSAGPSLRSG